MLPHFPPELLLEMRVLISRNPPAPTYPQVIDEVDECSSTDSVVDDHVAAHDVTVASRDILVVTDVKHSVSFYSAIENVAAIEIILGLFDDRTVIS